MEYRRLGRTNIDVSFVSLGTGGPSRLGQRTHGDEQRSKSLVAAALDEGVNLIDTAANYSDSEAILGRALRDVSRDRYYIATKFNPDPNDDGNIFSPEDLIESCERKLEASAGRNHRRLPVSRPGARQLSRSSGDVYTPPLRNSVSREKCVSLA